MSRADFLKKADELNGRVPSNKTEVSKEREPAKGLTVEEILSKSRVDKNYSQASIFAFEDVGLEPTMPNKKGIYIYGNVGVGKTYYSWGLYKRFVVEKFLNNTDIGTPSMLGQAIESYIYFARSSEIMDKIYDTFDRKEKKSHVIRKYVNYPVLVIDDLMAQSNSDYAHQCFLEIFDERLSGDKITIVTSNVKKEAISLKNERLGSRLKCLRTLYIGGVDRREDK